MVVVVVNSLNVADFADCLWPLLSSLFLLFTRTSYFVLSLTVCVHYVLYGVTWLLCLAF